MNAGEAAQRARKAVAKVLVKGLLVPKPPWLRGGGGGLVNTAASLRECEAQCKETASCRFGCFTESHECWLSAERHVVTAPQPCESTCVSLKANPFVANRAIGRIG